MKENNKAMMYDKDVRWVVYCYVIMKTDDMYVGDGVGDMKLNMNEMKE